jgi:hypothetical protein
MLACMPYNLGIDIRFQFTCIDFMVRCMKTPQLLYFAVDFHNQKEKHHGRAHCHWFLCISDRNIVS